MLNSMNRKQWERKGLAFEYLSLFCAKNGFYKTACKHEILVSVNYPYKRLHSSFFIALRFCLKQIAPPFIQPNEGGVPLYLSATGTTRYTFNYADHLELQLKRNTAIKHFKLH